MWPEYISWRYACGDGRRCQALWVAHTSVDELKACYTSLAWGEQAQAEHDTIASRSRTMKHDMQRRTTGDLAIFVPAVRSLKECIVSGETCESTAEVPARQKLYKKSELRSPVEGSTRTVWWKFARLVDMDVIDLTRAHSVITAALCRIKSTDRLAVCSIQNGFPAKASCGAPDPSAGGSSDQH